MSFGEILPIIIVIGIVVFLLVKFAPVIGALLELVAIVYWFLCNLFKWTTMPLAWLIGKIKDLLNKSSFIGNWTTKIETIDHRLDRFGGLSSVALCAASIVFIAVSLLVAWGKGILTDSLQGILLNNTFGSFITLMDEGFSFTPGILISASFASFLAHVCIDKADRVKWYIWIPYCVVFIGMSSILSSYLIGTFDAIGTWGYESILSLWNNEGASLFVKILRFVPLAVLAYFAVVALVITVREYFCSILFGVLGLIVLIIVALILQLFKASDVWTDVFATITVLGSMISIEKIRNNVEKDMTEKADAEDETPVIS